MSESGPALGGSAAAGDLPGRLSDLVRSLRRIVESPWPRDDAEAIPGMLTVLAAEFDPLCDPALTAVAHDIALRFGGIDVLIPPAVEPMSATVISAGFHSVCDATRAALEIASEVALAETDSAGDPLARLRIVLCTASDDDGAPLRYSRSLLARAEGGQILATAPTAVVAGPTLPAGIELLDRGLWTPMPDAQPERVYELCVGGSDTDGASASNLEWARRALHDDAGSVASGIDGPFGQAWTPVEAGSARMVLVSGGSATCRTRAAAELALRAHAVGALVLYGRWTEDDSEPYRGFREALGFHAAACGTEQLVADLQGCGDEIAHLLPEVGTRVGGARPGRSGSTFERAGMFDAVGTWLAAIADRTPTVLVLDDAHRAEHMSISLLSHLWHSARTHPLMIVVAAADNPPYTTA